MAPRTWTNSKKRWIAEGLCRDGVMTKPYARFPFGRVRDVDEFHAYYQSGESEDGEKFQIGIRALDTMVRRMLRKDFDPYAEEIPERVRVTDGVPNDGNVLVRWVYNTWHFYQSDVEDAGEEEVEEAEEGDGDVPLPGAPEERRDEIVVQPEQPSQEQPTVVEKDNNGQGAPATQQAANQNQTQFRLEQPSEEYIRRVEEYHQWIQSKD